MGLRPLGGHAPGAPPPPVSASGRIFNALFKLCAHCFSTAVSLNKMYTKQQASNWTSK